MKYADSWKLQSELFEKRRREMVGDHLLLVEHSPVISLGTSAEWNKVHVDPDAIKAQGVDYVQSPRGGGTAYLGPGQLVGYTIMDIAPYGGVLNFMKMLEETMILTARDFGIPIQRRDTHNPTTDKPYRATWYMGGDKPQVLCTKGVNVTLTPEGNKYTHHGFALNVNRPQTNYFHFIDQCGFPASDVEPVYMSDIIGKNLDWTTVQNSVSRNFSTVFSRKEEVKYAS